MEDILLYLDFTALGNGIFKALGYLLVIFFIYFAYKYPSDFTYKNKKEYVFLFLKGFFVILIIALFGAYNSGREVIECDDDPVYGDCIYEDVYISEYEQQETFSIAFTLLFLPYLYGLSKNYKERSKNK